MKLKFRLKIYKLIDGFNKLDKKELLIVSTKDNTIYGDNTLEWTSKTSFEKAQKDIPNINWTIYKFVKKL